MQTIHTRAGAASFRGVFCVGLVVKCSTCVLDGKDDQFLPVLMGESRGTTSIKRRAIAPRTNIYRHVNVIQAVEFITISCTSYAGIILLSNLQEYKVSSSIFLYIAVFLIQFPY